MLTAVLVTFFALSAMISTVLIAACALSGRAQAEQVCETVEVTPSIAEVKLPHYHLSGSLSA